MDQVLKNVQQSDQKLNSEYKYSWKDLLYNLELTVLIDYFWNNKNMSLQEKLKYRMVCKQWLQILDMQILRVSPANIFPDFQTKLCSTLNNLKQIDFSNVKSHVVKGALYEKQNNNCDNYQQSINFDLIQLVKMYPSVSSLVLNMTQFRNFPLSLIQNREFQIQIKEVELKLFSLQQSIGQNQMQKLINFISMREVSMKLSFKIIEKYENAKIVLESLIENRDKKFGKIDVILTQCEFDQFEVQNFAQIIPKLREIVDELIICVKCSRIDLFTLCELIFSGVNRVDFNFQQNIVNLHNQNILTNTDIDYLSTNLCLTLYQQQDVNLISNFVLQQHVTEINLDTFSIHPIQLFNTLKIFPNLQKLSYQEAFGYVQNNQFVDDFLVQQFCKQLISLKVHKIGMGTVYLIQFCTNLVELEVTGACPVSVIKRFTLACQQPPQSPLRNVKSFLVNILGIYETYLLQIVQKMPQLYSLKMSMLNCDEGHLTKWMNVFKQLQDLRELEVNLECRKLIEKFRNSYIRKFLNGVRHVRNVSLLPC